VEPLGKPMPKKTVKQKAKEAKAKTEAIAEAHPIPKKAQTLRDKTRNELRRLGLD